MDGDELRQLFLEHYLARLFCLTGNKQHRKLERFVCVWEVYSFETYTFLSLMDQSLKALIKNTNKSCNLLNDAKVASFYYHLSDIYIKILFLNNCSESLLIFEITPET